MENYWNKDVECMDAVQIKKLQDERLKDALNLYKFYADFVTPANSTLTLTNTIPITIYDTMFPCGSSRDCIPQPGVSQKVDILSYRQRPLHRLAYRNFGTHEALVTNQSVEARPGIAGVRWYEVRRAGGTYTVFQQGTYAPEDGVHRWMGSIAQDYAGNMALGYSVSSAVTYPSVRYAGRTASDPPGALPWTETALVAGTGTQSGISRWGDYSSMSVDPADDCTFWYTQQYYTAQNSTAWKTRIGSFRFPECASCPLLGRPSLAVVREAPITRLSWTEAANAAAYDAIAGDLFVLRAGGGDFGPSVLGCPANDLPGTTLDLVEALVSVEQVEPVLAKLSRDQVIIRKGDLVKFVATKKEYYADEVGILRLNMEPRDVVRAGDVGYIISGIKAAKEVRVGDTITHVKRACDKAIEGFEEVKPMVFAGVYPIDAEDYEDLRNAMEKLQLTDASLTYEPESSVALGFGFRCGFLGLLHMEIIQERIEREYGGCVLHERYDTGRGYRGESLNAWDPGRQVWHQTWVDSGGTLLLLEGGLKDGSMVMEGATTGKGGRVTKHRITWTPSADGSVRQHWESTDAEGKWATAFDGRYTKK